jgi:hypothetical protein
MSEHLLEPELLEPAVHDARRRPQPAAYDRLILSELAPGAVIDQLDDGIGPVELITFGSVRESCPRCREPHLKLVLRQRRVRLAHLFCTQCQSCYDAHYASGAPALTI